jgi:hypothetical protein
MVAMVDMAGGCGGGISGSIGGGGKLWWCEMEGMGQRIDGGFYISAARPGKPGLSFPAAKRRPDGGQTLWEESLWMRKRKIGPSEWETQTSISQAEKDVYGAADMRRES